MEKLIGNENINSNLSSFSIFESLLAKVLKHLTQTDMRNQVQKTMGRIFTKFSESKLLALNEVGIHNLITLFLTLAQTVELQSIVSAFAWHKHTY